MPQSSAKLLKLKRNDRISLIDDKPWYFKEYERALPNRPYVFMRLEDGKWKLAGFNEEMVREGLARQQVVDLMEKEQRCAVRAARKKVAWEPRTGKDGQPHADSAT